MTNLANSRTSSPPSMKQYWSKATISASPRCPHHSPDRLSKVLYHQEKVETLRNIVCPVKRHKTELQMKWSWPHSHGTGQSTWCGVDPPHPSNLTRSCCICGSPIGLHSNGGILERDAWGWRGCHLFGGQSCRGTTCTSLQPGWRGLYPGNRWWWREGPRQRGPGGCTCGCYCSHGECHWNTPPRLSSPISTSQPHLFPSFSSPTLLLSLVFVANPTWRFTLITKTSPRVTWALKIKPLWRCQAGCDGQMCKKGLDLPVSFSCSPSCIYFIYSIYHCFHAWFVHK